MKAEEIVDKMMSKDSFSKWMGIHVDSISEGSCTLSCKVKDDMLNGFEVLHGGISYSLADSALAFAANSYGFKCMSVETSISHTRPTKIGDKLTARTKEVKRGRTIGIYIVEVRNQDEKLVAFFKGTVNISQETWS